MEGVELDILNILRTINKPIYKTNISRLLVGSLKANSLCEKYKLRKYFGRYNYLTQKEIRKRVEHLVELGYLAKMEKSVKASPIFLSDKGKTSVNRTEECLVEKVWRKDNQSGLELSTKESRAETSRHPLCWILGESNDPKVIPKLIEFTKSADGNDRRLAASALGKLSIFKPQIFEAVPHLIKLLEDDKPEVRQYAAKALGKIGSEDAIPHLKRLLNDEKRYVREAAMTAIKRIKREHGEGSTCGGFKGFDGKLFGKLMKLRAIIAKEESIARGEDVPPYQIFYSSTLKEIAIKKPTTKEELRLIKGIGDDKKTDRYGEKVLKVIKKHLSERDNEG